MRCTRAAVALAVWGAALPAAAQGWRLSAAPAVEHLRLASGKYKLNYMGEVARVHLEFIEKAK